jgi:hypothetical protein
MEDPTLVMAALPILETTQPTLEVPTRGGRQRAENCRWLARAEDSHWLARTVDPVLETEQLTMEAQGMVDPVLETERLTMEAQGMVDPILEIEQLTMEAQSMVALARLGCSLCRDRGEVPKVAG